MVAAIVALSVAGLGYIATYLTNLRLSRRNEEVSRVSRQLSELYGPLLAYTESNSQLFRAWEKTLRADGKSPFAKDSDPPTAEELRAWQLWMRTVFFPNVCKARDSVVGKADLLIESEMPQVLLDLCAHVAAYEITIKQWESGGDSSHLAIVRYPDLLDQYARDSFRHLKERQMELLGHMGRRARRARRQLR